jgi:rubrerythrin
MNVLSYSADEILKIAISIEQNASIFYQDAARFSNQNNALKDLFLNLGAMEREHAKTFGRMRQELSDNERTVQQYDPGNEMVFYLQGMAGLHGWEGKNGPNARLAGSEKPQDVLSIAVQAEKETIYLYNFLRDFVPPRKGKDDVDRIIKEEMHHVALLNRELSKIAGVTV